MVRASRRRPALVSGGDRAARGVVVALILGLLTAMLLCHAWRSPAVAAEAAPDNARRHVPAGMSAKEYDAMLGDIADTVVRRLRSEPGEARVPADTQAEGTDASRMAQRADMFKGFGQLEDRAVEVAGYLPRLGDSLAQVIWHLGADTLGGFGQFVLKLLFGAILAIGLEQMTRRLLARYMRAQPREKGERQDVLRTMGRALLDMVPLIPLVLILYISSVHGFAANALQQKAAGIIFSAVLTWRVAALVLLLWFRPRDRALRIAAIDDHDARRLYYTLLGAALAYVSAQAIFNVLLIAGPPAEVVISAGFFNNLLFSVIDYTAIFLTRHATARWLASLVDENGGHAATAKLQLAKYWWIIAILADTVMTVALAYGMLSGNQDVGSAVVTSLTLTLVLIFLESLYDYIQRPPAIVAGSATTQDAEMRLIHLIARCLRFVTRLLIVTVVFEIWIFDVLPLVSPEDVPAARVTIRDIFFTVVLSFLIWQIACFYFARRLGEIGAGARAGASGRPPTAGSRLHTMLPLARLVLGIAIAVLATLTVLSRLGVNIAPLIAGASVLGLAVSFGSQTLVRDIISGFFYLVDDAFRVGEYIQSGNYRGTVESFSLRSVKLRHQNGPLFTVPFGMLGAIQNMSRDWAIEKFNIGVTYDTDIDKARKIIKKVGQELKTDPELAAGIIEPLKMQGVQAFGDFAIQLRMKMMTQPGDVQFLARRRALALIKRAFDANGINFAYPTVQVAGGTAGGASEAANAALAQKGLDVLKPKAAS
jgi:moderate conductance mechanosensitive channel